MSKIKRVAVLGGTGFVGRVLVQQLTKANYQVVIPSRERERHRDLLVNPKILLKQTNIHNGKALTHAIKDCDAVINLVGVLHDSKKPEYSFQGAHVELAKTVIAACETAGIERYLHMSSLKADAEKSPSKYLRSKGEAQNIAFASKLRVTAFRPSVIFGENDSFIKLFAGLLKIPNPIFALPSPNARFAPVHVEDVCMAFIKALEDVNTYGRYFSCCGPKIYSMRELIELIRDELGVKRKIIGLNDTLSKLTANILGIMPGKPFTKDNYQSMQVNSICKDNGLHKLGIKPRSLESEISHILNLLPSKSRLDDYRRTAAR